MARAKLATELFKTPINERWWTVRAAVRKRIPQAPFLPPARTAQRPSSTRLTSPADPRAASSAPLLPRRARLTPVAANRFP